MSGHATEKPGGGCSFAPASKGHPDANIVADDSGRSIIALLQQATEKTEVECVRAMDLAHKVSSQLRAAEERARELETEAAHFRDRASRAEEWLLRIHNEVEHAFFQEKNCAAR